MTSAGADFLKNFLTELSKLLGSTLAFHSKHFKYFFETSEFPKILGLMLLGSV